MVRLAQALGITVLVLGLAIYLGAVAGVFFAAATPVLDVGALTVLGTCLLAGAASVALGRQRVA